MRPPRRSRGTADDGRFATLRYRDAFTADPADRVIHLDALRPAGFDPAIYDVREGALNATIVGRLEYAPGSTAFLVYSHAQIPRDDGTSFDLRSLPRGPSQNVALLKLSWSFMDLSCRGEDVARSSCRRAESAHERSRGHHRLMAPTAPEFQARDGARGFDAPGATFPHRDERGRCSFEALVDEHCARDPVLAELARIVHGADFADEIGSTPESAGLRAIAHGFPLVALDDHDTLERATFLYDSLYAHLQARNATCPAYRARP